MPDAVTIRRARRLRQEMTGVEVRLWSYLRRRQLKGHRFRRQVPIGPYIADVACLAARLVIEIDGPSHDVRGDHDLQRDQWFAREGYRVLRFSADDVFWRCDWVLASIEIALGEAPPSRLRRDTSPPSGEEP
jgi:very-short-patch-repair endonuclease